MLASNMSAMRHKYDSVGSVRPSSHSLTHCCVTPSFLASALYDIACSALSIFKFFANKFSTL